MKALLRLAIDDWRRDFRTCALAVSVGLPTGALVALAFWGWVFA